MLGEHLSREVVRAEALLTESMAAGLGDSPVKHYERQLRILQDLEKVRAMIELYGKGAYLVLPAEGTEMPPLSPEAHPVVVGPWPMTSGKWGQALFVIRRDKHSSLAAASAALAEVLGSDIAERIIKFNSMADKDRRAWVVRYAELRDRVRKDGYSSLNAAELKEFVDLQTEVDYLKVGVSETSFSFVPR